MNTPTSKLALFGLLASVLTYICHKNAFERGKRLKQPPLYDAIHEILPNWSKHEYIRDLLLLLPIVIMFLYGNPQSGGGIRLLKKFFSYYIVIILIRCVTVSVTAMPAINPSDNYNNKEMGYLSLLKGTGHDLMFSGHTAFMMLSALIIIDHKLLPVPKEVVYLFLILYTILILLCRAHYTVDIIISALISYFVYDTGLHI